MLVLKINYNSKFSNLAHNSDTSICITRRTQMCILKRDINQSKSNWCVRPHPLRPNVEIKLVWSSLPTNVKTKLVCVSPPQNVTIKLVFPSSLIIKVKITDIDDSAPPTLHVPYFFLYSQ